jgi:hypothetical protein
VRTEASRSGPLGELAGWTTALIAACLVAVVRSHRLAQGPPPAARRLSGTPVA